MTRTAITILLLIGALGVGFWYLSPEWQNFQNLRNDTLNLQATGAELDGLIQNRDALINNINSISKDDLNKIDQSLPQGQQVGSALVFFENTAGQSGLVLKSIDLSNNSLPAAVSATGQSQPKPGASISAPNLATPFKELPISMNLIGTYDSLKIFLKNIEKNIRIIDVQNLTFSPAGSNGVFSISLKVITYYQ